MASNVPDMAAESLRGLLDKIVPFLRARVSTSITREPANLSLAADSRIELDSNGRFEIVQSWLRAQSSPGRATPSRVLGIDERWKQSEREARMKYDISCASDQRLLDPLKNNS